ncbi:MAG: uncharacterized protein QG636_693 [Patescibacteria group bacterium]|nr:uncharacterized protein [Patescibacteria group bacterium]
MIKAELRKQLVDIAKERQTKTDVSHDFQHVLRVCNVAEKIADTVNADPEIVIPAALFHDIVVYAKNSPESQFENEESAELAGEILSSVEGYPSEKIEAVKACIRECSFSKGTLPSSLESSVLQDADRMDSVGAISIMRTFSSGGQMNRPLYDPEDPFCKGENPPSTSVRLFYKRLLVVADRMHTDYAREAAKRRADFTKRFLVQLGIELEESGIVK